MDDLTTTAPVPSSRRWQVADVLTASRWPTALAFAALSLSPSMAVALVGWVWVSDALDGHLARAAGTPGRLAATDPLADAAVAVGLVRHLVGVGFLPGVSSTVVVLVLLAMWWATRVVAVQMLLQTLAYASFLLWVQLERAPGRGILGLVLLGVVLVERHRFVEELVPTFLHGWAALAGPRGRPGASTVGRGASTGRRAIVRESTATIETGDGQRLHVFRWSPEGRPKAVVQVQHGLAEHAARYRRFAQALTDAGYLVYAADARGSGQSAANGYGVWGPDGWLGWVDDVARLGARVRRDEPDLPLGLVGHSMGSFATQQHLLDHAAEVDAVVLSGSTEVSWLVPVLDADEPADLSTFNEPFEHRTGFEWLSRDEAEVDAYVADPACGWEAPPLAGIATLASAADPDRVAGIRPDLPILILSGSDDPLAQGGAAVEALGDQYRRAGLHDVEVRLYPGARHEILNETNRDEVTADIIAFLDRTLAG